MLTAVARDQRWPDVVSGISRFSKFAFVLFCYITNHFMTGPLGDSDFFALDFVLGNKIHCYPQDQSLSVKYLSLINGLFCSEKITLILMEFCGFTDGGFRKRSLQRRVWGRLVAKESAAETFFLSS